jgi:hypothetical protein
MPDDYDSFAEPQNPGLFWFSDFVNPAIEVTSVSAGFAAAWSLRIGDRVRT